MRIFIVILIVLCAAHSFAWNDAYKCIIKSAVELKDSGEFGESPTNFYVGREFTVDKITGRIVGGSLRNHNNHGKPQVLDQGSDQQAFKALTIFRPNITVNYLFVEEYNDNKEKPFMFIDSGRIYSGTCVAY